MGAFKTTGINTSMVTLSEGNTVAQIKGNYYVMSEDVVGPGKWYAEITYITVAGANNPSIGVAPKDYSTPAMSTHWYRQDFNPPPVYYGPNGQLYNGAGNNGGGYAYGSSYGSGAVIGILLDMDNDELYFYRNGIRQPKVAYKPSDYSDGFRVFCTNGNSSTSIVGQYSANFGQRPFTHVPMDLPLGTKSFDGSTYIGGKESIYLETIDTAYIPTTEGIYTYPIAACSNDMGEIQITASSTYDLVTYLPYKAFNGHNVHSDDCWVTTNGVVTGWIAIDVGRPITVSQISIRPRYYNTAGGGTNSAPRNFNILGSNDGESWVILSEVRDALGWSYAETRPFKLGGYRTFRHLKIDVLATVNGTNYVAIGGILLQRDDRKLVKVNKNDQAYILAKGSEKIPEFSSNVAWESTVAPNEKFTDGVFNLKTEGGLPKQFRLEKELLK